MNISGYYTQAGALHAAKINSGSEIFKISRIVACQGKSTAASSQPADIRQSFTVSTAQATSEGVKISVSLSSAQASSPYSINQAAVILLNKSGAEVLYRLYDISPSISISPGTNMTLMLDLYDRITTLSQPQISVSAAGYARAQDIISGIEAASVGSGTPEVISCTPQNLQNVILSLPKCIENNVIINVSSGSTGHSIIVDGFFGGGTLTIRGAGRDVTYVSGYVRIDRCSLNTLNFEKMTLNCGDTVNIDVPCEEISVTNTYFYIARSASVRLLEIKVGPASGTGNSTCGFYIFESEVTLNYISANLTRLGILIGDFSRARCGFYSSVDYQGCFRGIYVANSGIVFSTAGKGETLGSSANSISIYAKWL